MDNATSTTCRTYNLPERGGDVVKEMTFTNRVRIDDTCVCLDDLPAGIQESIINELIYRPLTTIRNSEIRESA